MRKRLIPGVLAGSCVLFVGMLPGAVFAQTPDGETPANEGTCNALQEPGVTRGLYGLCVAFCEAHDCGETGTGMDYSDCRPGSRKVLEKYNKRKQEGDLPMPCIVQEPCPCWSAEESAAIGSQGLGVAATRLNDISFTIRDSFDGSFISVAINPGGHECGYHTPATEPPTFRNTNVSPQEYETCLADILNHPTLSGDCTGNLCAP